MYKLDLVELLRVLHREYPTDSGKHHYLYTPVEENVVKIHIHMSDLPAGGMILVLEQEDLDRPVDDILTDVRHFRQLSLEEIS